MILDLKERMVVQEERKEGSHEAIDDLEGCGEGQT